MSHGPRRVGVSVLLLLTLLAAAALSLGKPQPAHAPSPRAAEARGDSAPSRLLNQAQINRIRLYETDLDEEPAVIVPRQTVNTLLRRYAGEPGVPHTRQERRRFRRLPGYRQLKLIFDLQARELYDQVRVRQDPPAIRAFRTDLNRKYVRNACGTARCHGGGKPVGGFRLFSKVPNADPTVYTNFYLLNQYRSEDGRMINRAQPAKSLLLQYGLPRADASTPHPDVPAWKPLFDSPDSKRFNRYARIINALWQPAPDYGISYVPPWKREKKKKKQPPATQPSPPGK